MRYTTKSELSASRPETQVKLQFYTCPSFFLFHFFKFLRFIFNKCKFGPGILFFSMKYSVSNRLWYFLLIIEKSCRLIISFIIEIKDVFILITFYWLIYFSLENIENYTKGRYSKITRKHWVFRKSLRMKVVRMCIDFLNCNFLFYIFIIWEGIGFMWKIIFGIFIKSLRFETPWVRKKGFYESVCL